MIATASQSPPIPATAAILPDFPVMWDDPADARLAWTFDRVSQPCGFTVDDLGAVTAPTLLLVGDRDPFCPVELGASAYRALPHGELAVLPNTANGITPAALQITTEFFQRSAG